MTETDDLPERSAQLRLLTTIVLLVLALAVGSQLLLNVLGELRDGVAPLHVAREFGEDLIRVTPAIFYLCALWAVRRVFGELTRAEPVFRPALERGLREVGSSLAWGAGTEVLGAPMLLRYVDGERGGAVAHYIPAAIAIGVVGLALVLLSRLIGRGAALQDELDSFI